MPRVRAGDKDVVAILTADWHLSHTPPRARAEEGWDWYMAQRRVLLQIKDLSWEHRVPVICAGDLFDRWNAPAELISFVLQHIVNLYAIPGNHDLPNHAWSELYRSAFATLLASGKLALLDPKEPQNISFPIGLRLWSFPCGFKPKPLEDPHDLVLEIAVVHAMIWTKKTAFPGAPSNRRLASYAKRLKGYDVAVFGDNHKPFTAKLGDTLVYNCGSLFRRTIDQIDHKPSVGLLHPDGSVTRHYLDCSQDQFRSEEELRGLQPYPLGDMSSFIEEVGQLQAAVLDFRQAVEQILEQKQVTKAIKKIVLQAMEEKA